MGVNRRNYYRILHLQPEAPGQVITATYRTMMSKLRLHPDLGGDTANAALINEAYAVLSDPARRAQYDAQLRRSRPGEQGRASCAASSTAGSNAGYAAPEPVVPGACLFCLANVTTRVNAQARCHRCASPLAAPPARGQDKGELFGRRAAPRMPRVDPVTLLTDWQTTSRVAQLRNLSLIGLSVITDVMIRRHQVIRIMGPMFDSLAKVADCRTDGRRFEVHASLLTAIFSRPSGVVVSVRT